MSKNTYPVSVAYTFTNGTQHPVAGPEYEWRGDEAQSWQTPFPRPSPIELETIDAHFQRVLNRFKIVEERRVSHSHAPGCWYSPTTRSPFAAAVGPRESRALWRIRDELDPRLGGWSMPTGTQHSVDWPAPPPPPRPYSPSPTPWMEPSSADSVLRVAGTETERRVEGIPTRISRMARPLPDSPMPSYVRVPAAASMDAYFSTSHGPTLPPSHCWSATPPWPRVSHMEKTIPAATLTGDLLPSLPVSQVDGCAAWPPMLNMPDDTTGQHGSGGRLRTMVDYRLGGLPGPRGSEHTGSPSDGGHTYGDRSPMSMSECIHTPDEVRPWSERRIDCGYGTWVIRGPSDQHVRPRPESSAFPAPSYHHDAGTMRYEYGPGISQPAWGYIQQEADERIRQSRKESAIRRVLVATGLWEVMGRR